MGKLKYKRLEGQLNSITLFGKLKKLLHYIGEQRGTEGNREEHLGRQVKIITEHLGR